MKSNVFENVRKRHHDDNYRNKNLPCSAEVFAVCFTVLPVSPDQRNNETRNENQRKGNLSV